MHEVILSLVGGCLVARVGVAAVARADNGMAAVEASNMESIGHSDLDGYGSAGEGLTSGRSEMDSVCSTSLMNLGRRASVCST